MSTFSQALCVISVVIGVQAMTSSGVLAFELAGAWRYTSVDRSELTNATQEYTPPEQGAGSGSPNSSTGTGTR
ncbi:hypothetical protein ACN4EK_19025 [Pantanalinema rosaneae CENA516]|uniref:hypothetical protein n=1 Tax=Pantanalinema rosaneae TaxID=1620701 RepID=UPI003D6F6308